jgi:anti-sigma factor RsiW
MPSDIPSRDLTCKDVHDFLMAYLDGDVTPAERRAFDEHLGACASCVRYLEQYKRTIQLSRDAGETGIAADANVPAGLIEAIRAARRRG